MHFVAALDAVPDMRAVPTLQQHQLLVAGGRCPIRLPCMMADVRIIIEGHDLPGARFCSDGAQLQNVHVAAEVGRDPVGLVRGDAESARWELDVRAVVVDGSVDLRGPAVHGKRGERFLYLTWGEVCAAGSFAMFRRAKLMFGDVDPDVLLAAARDDGTLIASVSLTDEHGGPRCARVRPPDVAWCAGGARVARAPTTADRAP